MSIEQSPTETMHTIDFKVEGTRLPEGARNAAWRITTTDKSSQHEREYWVEGSEIFLVDLKAHRPWNHATPFVIGKRAVRISPQERQAITKAIAHWMRPLTDTGAHRRRIKWIREGSYIGIGFRRSEPQRSKAAFSPQRSEAF